MRTMTTATRGDDMTGDQRSEIAAQTARTIHSALSSANLEYSAYSGDGVNLFGDLNSIKAAAAAFHDKAQIDDLKRDLRHWRDECGKLHAKVTAAKATGIAMTATEDDTAAASREPDSDVA